VNIINKSGMNMYFIYSGIIADYTKENKQIDTEQQTVIGQLAN
jgi:hypothetical protein